MSQKSTATNQIKKYGTKGDVVLIPFSVISEDVDNLTVTSIEDVNIPLQAYVPNEPNAKTEENNDRRTGFKILAALDNDFDGTVTDKSKIDYRGRRLDITSYIPRYVKGELCYVEFVVNG